MKTLSASEQQAASNTSKPASLKKSLRIALNKGESSTTRIFILEHPLQEFEQFYIAIIFAFN